VRGGTGLSQKAVPEDNRKWTRHVARPHVFHGMAVPAVWGGADMDPSWGCARQAWGTHEAAWLCCEGEVWYRSWASMSIKNSNKIAKIPAKFVSSLIEHWESYHRSVWNVDSYPRPVSLAQEHNPVGQSVYNGFSYVHRLVSYLWPVSLAWDHNQIGQSVNSIIYIGQSIWNCYPWQSV
jgi:hypothetical protein